MSRGSGAHPGRGGPRRAHRRRASTMNTALKEFVGQRVDVRSGPDQGFADTGILEAYEEPWLLLRKANELLCFTVYNVRLVKLADRRPGDPHLVGTQE